MITKKRKFIFFSIYLYSFYIILSGKVSVHINTPIIHEEPDDKGELDKGLSDDLGKFISSYGKKENINK